MSALPPLLPYLTVSDGAGAIEFYKKAFGAVEHELHHAPGSTKIMNACLSINGGVYYAPDAPFGGYKQSGIGREMGVAGLEEFLELKTMAEPATT